MKSSVSLMTRLASCGLALLFAHTVLLAREFTLSPDSDLRSITRQVQPGDCLVLTDGTWTDVDLRFDSLQGTTEAPILIRAQSPGKVIVTGRSTLGVSGQHIVVSGLVIHNPQGRSDVVSLRTHSQRHASYCRITQCTFRETSESEAGMESRWLSVYGRHNRVDHCYFEGKKNQGTTLVIWVGQDRQHHRIDHNHFAARPPLGKNGGETIRIGTSDTCHRDSASLVEYNYFFACDGEVEIVSNKSCGNVYRHNLFEQCSGALTLRHGDRCRVEHNAFLGQKKNGTGGVRIIGAGHEVVDNYFEQLRGDGARAAISLMNGIENSPASGYAPVRDATMAGNTLVDCKVSLEIGVGAGPGQSVAPAHCTLRGNRFLPGNWPIFRVHATPVDFVWQDNRQQTGTRRDGALVEFPETEMSMQRGADGMLHEDASQGDFPWPRASTSGPTSYRPTTENLR